VVVFEINLYGIFTSPPEGHAPRAVDVHRIANRLAAQLVKVEAGDVYTFRGWGGM